MLRNVLLDQRNPGEELPTVLFIPGSIFPAADSYGQLLSILRNDIEFIMKDFEFYQADTPPTSWGLGTEVEAFRRFADSMGFDTFHVVGYSFGGSLALAFASRYMDQLRSITLIEPDWIGNLGMSPEELEYREELRALFRTPPERFLDAFMRLKVRSGVSIPRLDITYALEKRAVGVRAFLRSFETAELLYGKLANFSGQVYVVVGNLSHPVEMVKARRLNSVFANCSISIYEGCHHWAPPQMSQPGNFATAMRKLWFS